MNIPQADSDNKTIIDEIAMLRIKRYIERKHPDFNSSQRAALFANAVHRIIDQHLPDFDEQTKVMLRRELLTRIGIEQRFTLMSKHILEACLKLDLEESGMNQLALWMDKRQLTGSAEARPHDARADKEPFRHRKSWRLFGIAIILFAQALIASPRIHPDISSHNRSVTEDVVITEQVTQSPGSALPSEYQYRALNVKKLKAWLQAKKSLLAEEPYFTAIVTAAKESDIHPLLLFAITGQEQAYVPNDRKQSKQIANNPFNIYSSWKSYNTNIADSARIASKTIVSISRNRPADVHPIMWLNTKYAEDPNWWVGVTSIFEKMRKEIEGDG